MSQDNSAPAVSLPPKLPLPDIKMTLGRYLNAVETFTPPNQLAITSQLVDQFLEDQQKVKAVMELLQEKFQTEENWAYKWWLDDMYLKNMLPLPISSSPGWVFPRQKFDTTQDMLKYMAKLIQGWIHFKQQLEKGDLPCEMAPGRSAGVKMQLCMRQFERLLGSYRKPGNGQDVLDTCDHGPNEEEHVVVMAYTHMFKMPVKQEGQWLDLNEVLQLLTAIENEAMQSEDLPTGERAPLLTSETRNAWYNARQQLLEDDHNVSILKAIETCLFVVCIDHAPQNPTDVERSQKDIFRQMLTGNGTRFNGSNRWFDKTIQLIVSMDGANGMCYEHTPSEGVAVVTAMVNVFKYIDSLDTEEASTAAAKYSYMKMEFNLTEDLKDLIWQSGLNLDKLDADTDNEVFMFADYGKAFVKSCNCSPDAFLQMSLQLAYFKLYGALCPTYESASTRRFHCGRVDSIRASHPEALAWAKAMLDKSKSKEDKKELFKAAIAKQTKVMKENIFGEGVDVPLLGIRMACEQLGLEEKLFEDPTFTNANKFKLSTSQVPINLKHSYMGYGAVVPDGYGVSYNLQDDHIIFAICSFFSCETTNSRRFARALVQSLMELKDLYTASIKKKESIEK